MILVSPPVEFTGEGIRSELEAAGFPDARVVLVAGQLRITGVADPETAAAVIAAYVPDVPAPSPPIEDRVAALEQTVDQLLSGDLTLNIAR